MFLLLNKKNSQSPKLNKAVPLREDGTVEKPPEEKSFLQKYWQVDLLEFNYISMKQLN
jgi:hypothetical protein